jgi:hypothetical protein
MNSFSGTVFVAPNELHTYIWVYFWFSGDIYDSTSTGLTIKNSFTYTDSVYVNVIE